MPDKGPSPVALKESSTESTMEQNVQSDGAEVSSSVLDPVISKELRVAIAEFESAVRYEKEWTDESILIDHMRNEALARVLTSVIRGDPAEDVIAYLGRVSQSFRTYRRDKHMASTSIRVYRRQH